MSNEILFLDPEQPHGPAFAALTEMQQKFVIASLILGGGNDAEAARVAGYAPEFAKQQAYTLMRKPSVVAALKEEAELRITGGAMLASSALVAIVKNPLHKDHFKACIELLNRSGLQFIQKHEVIHTDNRAAAELVRFIKTMAQKNNLDPATLLGYDDGVVDAAFTEVKNDLSSIMAPEDDEADS